MAKLDLGLISQQGYGIPVPKEMDRHMVKYVVGQRKAEVGTALAHGDNSPFVTNVRDHSDVFYAIRTHLNRLGWDTSVYTDSVSGGSKRRKAVYDMIQDVCENFYGVKRHQIGIYPAERAIMAFNGQYFAVGYDNLRTLMQYGTDVIVVEKAGTVTKMVPFTKNNGIAFIQSQGFVSEYGIALARLANRHNQVSKDYTKSYVPKYVGHIGVLVDCDSSGIGIGLKIPGAIRLGIDLNTIKEMNEANPGLGIKLEDLEERTIPNTHWIALVNLLSNDKGGKGKNGGSSTGKGRIYDEIMRSAATKYEGLRELMASRKYLLQQFNYSNNDRNGNNNITFIEYLKDHRIELNTILAAAGPQAFWNWLRAKLLKVWPNRDYRRAMFFDDYMLSPTMKEFIEWYQDKSKPIIARNIAEAKDELSTVRGLIDDIHDKQQEIESDILNNTLLKNEEIQKLDKTLQKIMNDRYDKQ
jgi:hypothetical protein